MKINNFNSIVIKDHPLIPASTLANAIISMKSHLNEHRVSPPPLPQTQSKGIEPDLQVEISAQPQLYGDESNTQSHTLTQTELNSSAINTQKCSQVQRLYHYATISTQNNKTYEIHLVTLNKSPIELCSDMHNIPALHKQMDRDSKTRVGIACFTRLLILYSATATETQAYAQHLSQHTFEVLEYLNGGHSTPAWLLQAAHNTATHTSRNSMGELRYYIPVLSELELANTSAITLKMNDNSLFIEDTSDYLALIKLVNVISQQVKIDYSLRKDNITSQSLIYYTGLSESNGKYNLCLILSDQEPTQLLSTLDAPTPEALYIINFANTYSRAKTISWNTFSDHKIITSINPRKPEQYVTEALTLLNRSGSRIYSINTIEQLESCYTTLQEAQYLSSKKTIVQKRLWQFPLLCDRSSNLPIKKIKGAITSYIANISNRHKEQLHGSTIFYYIGLSQQHPNKYHLNLMLSYKSPIQLIEGISTPSLEEKSILSFAHAYTQIVTSNPKSILALPKILSNSQSHTYNLFCTALTLLNKDIGQAVTAIENILQVILYNHNAPQVMAQLSHFVPSALHLDNKLFQESKGSNSQHFRDSIRFNDLWHFLRTTMTNDIPSKLTQESLKSCEPYFFYAAIQKNKDNHNCYLTLMISHKSPSQMLCYAHEDIATLSLEAQSVICFSHIFAQTKETIEKNIFDSLTITPQIHSLNSDNYLLDALNLFNQNQHLGDLIRNNRKMRSEGDGTLILLTEMLDSIPYAPT